jgi:hypothetical protein
MRRFASTAWVLAVAAAVPAGVAAQNEKALRKAFEGRLVAPRLDMPATDDGVNVYPNHPTPLDVGEVERDLATHGVGVHRGQAVHVTRIKVKGKHIEFQLGNGGKRQEPTFSTPYVPESRAEKRLRDQLKEAKSEDEKKRLKDLIRDYEDRRRREQVRLEALKRIEYETILARHTPEEWAQMAGARFNLRFDQNVPKASLTTSGFAAMLERWIDFDPPPGAATAVPLAAPAELRKGMSFDEVVLAFGKAASCEDSKAGDLKVRSCTWRLSEGILEAQFVGGVVVKYTLSSGPSPH